MIICKLCNKQILSIRGLSSHLRYNHPEYNIRKYYDKFLRKENEGICQLKGCDNKTNFVNINIGYSEHCCKSHAQKNPKTREKIKHTNFKKYGDENYFNLEKSKQTKKERYGDEKYNNRPKCSKSLLNRSEGEKENWRNKVRKKWKQKTNNELQKISKQRKQTFKEKYNNESYPQMKAFEAIKEKYNVDNPSQISTHSKKIKQTWKNKSVEEKEKINLKRRNTFLERYGVTCNMHIEETKNHIIKKARKTKIKNKQWLSDYQIPLFHLYYRRVYYFTSRSKKEKYTKEDLSKIGKCGVIGALQVDHMLSIKEGFLNNILPSIIGHKNNLQIISWEENDSKKAKCDITLDTLIKSIEAEGE